MKNSLSSLLGASLLLGLVSCDRARDSSGNVIEFSQSDKHFSGLVGRCRFTVNYIFDIACTEYSYSGLFRMQPSTTSLSSSLSSQCAQGGSLIGPGVSGSFTYGVECNDRVAVGYCLSKHVPPDTTGKAVTVSELIVFYLPFNVANAKTSCDKIPGAIFSMEKP